MTLEEIARELGVSKSTVSRALSGKGRIGEETRQRIMSYASAQGGAGTEKSKPVVTKNLGVIFPEDIYVTGIPYFYDCLLGICEAATLMDYNILLTAGTATDISGIKNLVELNKVDGVILTRSLENDRAVEYLRERKFPVGMTGLCEYKEVLQVDTDNEAAAESLTSLLIGRGFRKFALIVEDLDYHVNRNRHEGFCNALLKNGLSREQQVFYTGCLKTELLDAIIADIMSKKVECILCGDDVVCTRIVSRLQAEGYRIPKDIAVASFYNSSNLNSFSPAITAVNVSAKQIGNTIGKQMIQYLQGKEYQSRIMLDYEILFRKSTNRV